MPAVSIAVVRFRELTTRSKKKLVVPSGDRVAERQDHRLRERGRRGEQGRGGEHARRETGFPEFECHHRLVASWLSSWIERSVPIGGRSAL